MGAVYTYGSTLLNDNVNLYLQEKPFEFPTYVQTTFKMARLEGVKKTGETVNGRTIQMKIKVVGSSRADLETRLSNLYQGLALRQQRLTMYTLDTRYFIADAIVASPVLVAGSPVSVILPVTFFCQQPYAFSVAQAQFDTGVISLNYVSGKTFNFPLQTFAGGGTIFSRPQIRVMYQSGPSWTSVTINQQTDNYAITENSVNLTTSGDYLDFFCDPWQSLTGYTVQKNSSGVPLAFSGLFPPLESTNTAWQVTIIASSTTATTGRLIWTWTPRWM